MLTRLCFLAIIAMSFASVSAQVIYEPVQYQYGDQNKFYYGGTDPHVFARAAAPSDPGAEWGRVEGYDFASGDTWVHREMSDQPIRVYSDALPTQIASLYGFTATDAANVANASVPRYFRKADVLAAASQAPGILIVPARAVLPSAAARPPATTRPLIVVPSAIVPAHMPAGSDKLVLASH
jgi:hypothetical protein